MYKLSIDKLESTLSFEDLKDFYNELINNTNIELYFTDIVTCILKDPIKNTKLTFGRRNQIKDKEEIIPDPIWLTRSTDYRNGKYSMFVYYKSSLFDYIITNYNINNYEPLLLKYYLKTL